MPLSIPYLLSKDFGESEKFFKNVLSRPKLSSRGWILWNYAFTLFRHGNNEKAKFEWLSVLDTKPQPVLRLVTIFMLNRYFVDNDLKNKTEEERVRLGNQYTYENWKKLRQKASENIEVVIIAHILTEAENWLYRLSDEPDKNKNVN